MKMLRITLFILICIGLALLATQSWWLDTVVTKILTYEGVVLEVDTSQMASWNWVWSEPSGQGTQYSYPFPFPATYVSAVEWPPLIEMTAGDFSCASPRTINRHEYCVMKEQEGAAGSTYTTYTYAEAQGDFVSTLTFTLRTPQCMNYDDPKQSACIKEQTAFPIDDMADRILQSIRML